MEAGRSKSPRMIVPRRKLGKQATSQFLSAMPKKWRIIAVIPTNKLTIAANAYKMPCLSFKYFMIRRKRQRIAIPIATYLKIIKIIKTSKDLPIADREG